MENSVRVEKSVKNLVYGVGAQFLKSMMGFASRIVIVHTLGIRAVSLNGLFTEVIAMLSMAEMGVGAAIVYNLYVPLKQNDEKKLAELMNLFKWAYRIIFAAILGIGLCLTPFVHLFVTKMEIDLWYLRLIYILFLVQTASSYLFSYKSSLLSADQKVYVVSKYSTIIQMIYVCISIIFLILTRNYIVYLVIQIFMTLTSNIVISRYADKIYPFLKRKDRISKQERNEVLSNVKHLFISQLSGKITNSTDNILISMLVGTLRVGAYSSYTLITGAMTRIMEQLSSATTGSVGNLMAEGDMDHLDLVLRRLTFITYLPTVIAANGFFCAATPLVRLLFGEHYRLPSTVIFVTAFNFFLLITRNPLWQMMRVSGLFSRDKNTSIAGSVVNLIVSVILGMKLGILGILIGTTCTHVIQIVLKTRILYSAYFKRSQIMFSELYLKLTVMCGLIFAVSKIICKLLPIEILLLQFAAYGLVAVVVAAVISYAAFCSCGEWDYTMETLKDYIDKFKNEKHIHI